jgi:hypothetical protein
MYPTQNQQNIAYNPKHKIFFHLTNPITKMHQEKKYVKQKRVQRQDNPICLEFYFSTGILNAFDKYYEADDKYYKKLTENDYHRQD